MYLKCMRGMRETQMTYVILHHVQVAHIFPGSGTYLNFDKKLISRTTNIDASSKLRLSQDTLDKAILNQGDAFKIDDVMVYQMISKMFTDMDAFVYIK